ncbi:ras-like GTP-binding protein RYL1 [Cyclospora cayetanensis]|uniref:Ras-related protein Rab-1 n=1 Tax=Cyclospora cayetanensis TaxID=88456 RepID=A0A6P6RRP8_9EIME|nr:ras-like GTP-binding protein RYL1 [Cyclospora cayetanensis]
MTYRGGRREKAEPFDHLVKLLVLGDSSVGKSSLLLRFAENKFDPNFVLTIGVDFKTKVVECGGRRIKLQVWDTAGQERFRTITPAYFRSAMGVMLVYDITNMQTFHNIRRWMQNVEEFADPSIVRVLVANKLDLQQQRQVSRSKGEDLAREYAIPFIETSAKSNINVEEAFMCAANRIRDLRFSPGPIESATGPTTDILSSSQQLSSHAATSRVRQLPAAKHCTAAKAFLIVAHEALCRMDPEAVAVN